MGARVSLGGCNVARSADLNFLPDHLTAVIGYVRAKRAVLKFPGSGRSRDDSSQIVGETDSLPMRTRHNFGPDSR